MNILESCLPKRTGTPIYLPDDDEYDSSSRRNRNCFPCCNAWTDIYLGRHQREGLIRLPTGGGGTKRRTIDDYLDPRSPVSIEVLLAEQEEELDHYYGQTDDEDVFIANKQRRKYSLVSQNNTFFEEEDAQFLSEHRISAILVDRPKLNSAHAFTPEIIVDSTLSSDQELLDVIIPAVSTSTSSISSRVFAIKKQPENEDFHNASATTNIDTNITAPRPITDVGYISSSPLDMKSPSYHQTISPSSSSSSASSSAASSILSSASTAEHENNYVLPLHLTVGSSNSLSLFPTTNTAQQQHQQTTASMTPSHSTRKSEFPATTLTRTPYQPLPPMHTNITPVPSTNNSNIMNPVSLAITSDTATMDSSNTLLPPPPPLISINNTAQPAPLPQPAAPTPFLGRRPSVVQAAQNLLGDKLDDFTEKLAFIRKNIIMSMDSDDEEELSQNNHYYDTAPLRKKSSRKSLEAYSNNSGSREQYQQQSGGEKSMTWDNFILPKFKSQQASTSTSFLQQKQQQQSKRQQQPQQQQEQQQMRFPRSSSLDLNSHNAVPQQHHVTCENDYRTSDNTTTSDHYGATVPRRDNQKKQRKNSTASFTSSFSNSPATTTGNNNNKNGFADSDDDEELVFDFSKVVAISKNVRTFGEGVMDNGLRMFNNLSTRIKNNANNIEVEQLGNSRYR